MRLHSSTLGPKMLGACVEQGSASRTQSLILGHVSLQARPLFTKCMTSLTGFAIGDSLAQVLLACEGTTFAAPYGHT